MTQWIVLSDIHAAEVYDKSIVKVVPISMHPAPFLVMSMRCAARRQLCRQLTAM